MNRKIKIGLLGAGVVGSGVIKTLAHNPSIEIKKIGVKDLNKKRDLNGYVDKSAFTTNINDIITDPEIEIIVEVLGGLTPTKDIVMQAIQNKKHIVTANKDLIATYGAELFDLAKKMGVQIQFEASVCGGIPIINTLKQTLIANKFKKIIGILNGTTNYILSEMLNKKMNFEMCLKEAQREGYAEPDPINDISGKDVAYKIAILASIAFGERIKIEDVFYEGIEKISLADVFLAEDLGYRLKLIGMVEQEESGLLDIRVHPSFIKKNSTLASVFGANNGVLIKGDLVGELTFIGPGAGSMPTASSILGDINMLRAQLASSKNPNPLFVCQHSDYAKIKPISETENGYFLRIQTEDKSGVVGQVGTIFGNADVSIDTLTQRGINPDGSASITILTHVVKEKKLQKAISEVKKLNTIKQVENVIRVLE
ncbi:MAG: homoserine dehydrogenase [Candidatus Melainabacteria bacterium]|nr:homoserine dehydrogenase [Candidatus Melainabacteria bacterium]